MCVGGVAHLLPLSSLAIASRSAWLQYISWGGQRGGRPDAYQSSIQGAGGEGGGLMHINRR